MLSATSSPMRLTSDKSHVRLERAFYLKLKEETFEVPGWLLSTGTLRIVALLACLRHPKPPPVLIVEEIENGLDPRTLHLLVEEIRAAITEGTTQVILTTHSPYLLDLLDLSHIVVVERENGQPVFRRPDAEQLAEWSKSFDPGTPLHDGSPDTRPRRPDRIRNPKGVMNGFFQRHRGWRCVDVQYARSFAACLQDLSRLRHCETFRRFESKVTGREN